MKLFVSLYLHTFSPLLRYDQNRGAYVKQSKGRVLFTLELGLKDR